MTKTSASFFGVTNRVFYSSFAKAFEPQETGIAFAAGETFQRRIVTTVGDREINIELDCFANDFGFRKFDKRRVNLKAFAFDACFCSEIGQGLKRFDEFRAAIRVAAIIDRVYAKENVAGSDHLRPGKRVREKDGVTRGDVRDRDAVRDFRFQTLFWDIGIASERGAAE